MNEYVKKYGYYLILACILVFGFFLRLKWLAVNPSFWDDECSLAWNVIHKSYLDFFSVLNYTQVAPPFFMILSKFITHIFGVRDFVLRLTPFLFGIFSMILFLLVSKEIFENKLTVIISNLIFSINQTLINYASEFKQYSCDVFFTLLCFYLFLDLLSKKTSIKKNILYSAIFIVSTWFSFVSVFIITAGFMGLFIKQLKEKKFDFKNSLILVLPVFVNCLFYLNFYIIKTYTSNITELNNYWHNSYIAKDFSNLLFLVKNIISYFIFPSQFTLPAILAIIAGMCILFKKKPYPTLILLITILLEGFASWLGYYPFEKRVILFLLPIVLLFIAAIFEAFDFKHKFKSFFILICFFVLFAQPLLYNFAYIKAKSPNRGYFPREMMELMLKNIKPDDIIVINRYSRTDFAYYSSFYKINNKVILEGQKGDRLQFLNSLPRQKYYWLYLPFGKSPTFDKWIYGNNNKVLQEAKGRIHSQLVYLYAK